MCRKNKNCYFCEHCIVKENLVDFECDVTKHLVIESFEETEYFRECKGKDFVKE